MKTVRKMTAGLALLSIELVIVVILFIVSLFGFTFFTRLVFGLEDQNFDRRVFAFLVPFINEATTSIILSFTFLADQYFLLPANIILAGYFLFFRKHNWYSLKIPVVSLGSVTIMYGLKLFFSRPRPADPVYEAARGFSYPSGHAMSAMTFYGLIIYLIWTNVENKTTKWTLAIILSLLIIVIGFSRVYLRVHFASDVLAGFAMGIIWLVSSLWVMNKIEYRNKNKIINR